jgi:hypothetical protein
VVAVPLRRLGVGSAVWPPGAWKACEGDCAAEGEPVWLGVDVGGARSASALIGVTDDLQVAEVHIFQGDGAVLEVTDRVLEIAERRAIVEVAYDPMRFHSEALRLEQEHGLTTVQFDQSETRMIGASENLHRVIVEGKLTQPGDPELSRHVGAAVAKQTRRGWRLDKLAKRTQIDGAIALAIACKRVETKPAPTRWLGFAA